MQAPQPGVTGDTPDTEPGLRGGTAHYDAATATWRLDRVTFVRDLPITGTLRYRSGTATLTGGALTVSWTPFRATDGTTVTGTYGGTPFTLRLPAF